MSEIIPIERMENRIYLIRGLKVMLDRDLAELYELSTKRLKEQVKRNIKRFPDDFMIILTKNEAEQLLGSRSQIATLKRGQNIKYLPIAFTELGVAMLSSMLNSEKAVEVNILIMRAFVRLRQMLSGHKELARKVEELERKYSNHEVEITTVFKLLKKLMEPPPLPKKGKIGFAV